MNDVLASTVGRVEGDLFLQTHSTNPLLRSETIDRAIAAFIDDNEHDSLFSVTPLQARLWDRLGEPINHDPGELIRTQDLAPIFVENSCLYVFRRDTFATSGNRLGRAPLMFEIPASEAWDIDDEDDLAIAECLLRGRGGG
jgi:CMP-N-acetylneuraminic acid synthetase